MTVRLTVVACAFVCLYLLLAGRLFDRAGRAAIDVAMADFAYSRATVLAKDVGRTLDAHSRPTPATADLIRRFAEQRDLSIVLFLEADTPLLSSHGPSLASALRAFSRRNAPGASSDTDETPFIPEFPADQSPQAFPWVAGRPVRVQTDWPFAVEAPVRQRLTLRVLPLDVPPVWATGSGGGLLVLAVLLGLLATLAVGRILRPLEAFAESVAAGMRRGGKLRLPGRAIDELRRAGFVLTDLSRRAQRERGRAQEVSDSIARGLLGTCESLVGDARLLDGSTFPPQVREQVGGLARDVEDLAAGVADLALWSDLAADRARLAPAPTSVRSCVEAAVAAAAMRLPLAPKDLLLTAPDDVDAGVHADEARLRTAIRHLLTNAANHAQPPIEVTLRRGPSRLEIVVADQGTGLPVDGALKRMLEPYRRGDEVGEPGFGLGLGIARRVAELHGGGLELLNQADGGLEARLWLPAPPVSDRVQVAADASPDFDPL